MSVFGEEIIDRLHEKCSLRQTNNPVRKIIDNSVGEWFDNYDDQDFMNMFFLTDAVGAYLDEWGKIYGVKRYANEADDDYRQRIVLESLGHLTVEYLTSIYDLKLYSFIQDYSPSNNQLTSDNPYIAGNGFMSIVSPDVQRILKKKFVIGNNLILRDCWDCRFFDAGDTGRVNSDWWFDPNYTICYSDKNGTTVINKSDDIRRLSLNKKNTSRYSMFDWMGNVTLEFDVVASNEGARIQLHDGINNASYILDNDIDGHCRVVYNGVTTRFYIDDVLKQTTTKTFTGNYRISFSLPVGAGVCFKNFMVR